MDEILYANILRMIGLVASITGIIIGVDLIFGGPIVNLAKRGLEKSFDFDKMIKRVLEKSFDFDNKIITNPKVKRGLGIIFLIFSLIILLLIKRM